MEYLRGVLRACLSGGLVTRVLIMVAMLIIDHNGNQGYNLATKSRDCQSRVQFSVLEYK